MIFDLMSTTNLTKVLMDDWIYKGNTLDDSDIPENSIGFLYRITDEKSGNWYIGRKLTTKAATKQVKGKKKKIRKESDWRTYWSSSKIIKSIIDETGTINLKREILIFVYTKASLTYGEEYLLYSTGALFDKKCLNENIRAKVYRTWFAKTPTLHEDLKKVNLTLQL